MRPGTYIPTHPREIQAFAMERLRKQSDEYSKQLAFSESLYRTLGTRYHNLPLTYRESVVHPELAMDSAQAFLFETDDTDDSVIVSRLAKNITQLREYRESAKQALRDHDVDRAERELTLMEELLLKIQETLDDLGEVINVMCADFFESPSGDNREVAAEALSLRKLWAINLPEVVNAFSTGMISTESEALSMAFSSCHEEWFLD